MPPTCLGVRTHHPLLLAVLAGDARHQPKQLRVPLWSETHTPKHAPAVGKSTVPAALGARTLTLTAQRILPGPPPSEASAPTRPLRRTASNCAQQSWQACLAPCQL